MNNSLTKDIWRRLDAGDTSRNPYLNKKAEKTEVIPPVISPVNDVDLGSMIMDSASALNGEEKTQDDWIKYWNSVSDGRIMASMSDYYLAGKFGGVDLISSLRKNFKDDWIVGSDRIVYDKNSLDATIISYFGSTKIIPIQRKVYIPEYNFVVLDSVLADPLGLTYLQSLFNTSDTVEDMEQTLFDLSGKFSSTIKVSTLDQSSRNNFPYSAAFLYYTNGNFYIFGDNILDLSGHSYGVRK